jgi:hypothetical protein
MADRRQPQQRNPPRASSLNVTTSLKESALALS